MYGPSSLSRLSSRFPTLHSRAAALGPAVPLRSFTLKMKGEIEAPRGSIPDHHPSLGLPTAWTCVQASNLTPLPSGPNCAPPRELSSWLQLFQSLWPRPAGEVSPYLAEETLRLRGCHFQVAWIGDTEQRKCPSQGNGKEEGPGTRESLSQIQDLSRPHGSPWALPVPQPPCVQSGETPPTREPVKEVN